MNLQCSFFFFKVQKLFKLCQLTKKVEFKTKKVLGASMDYRMAFFFKKKIIVHSELTMPWQNVKPQFFFSNKVLFFCLEEEAKGLEKLCHVFFFFMEHRFLLSMGDQKKKKIKNRFFSN